MDKTLHINFSLEGPDVDQLDVYASLMKMAEEEKMDFVIKSGTSNIYYNPTKINIPKKEEK